MIPVGKNNAGLKLAPQMISWQRDDSAVLQAMYQVEQVFEFTEVACVGVAS